MNITTIHEDDLPFQTSVPKPDDDTMRKEYNYILAEHLTGKLLAKGLITADEFNKIMVRNRETFSPLIAQI